MPIVSFDNATVAGSAPTREQLAAALPESERGSAAPFLRHFQREARYSNGDLYAPYWAQAYLSRRDELLDIAPSATHVGDVASRYLLKRLGNGETYPSPANILTGMSDEDEFRIISLFDGQCTFGPGLLFLTEDGHIGRMQEVFIAFNLSGFNNERDNFIQNDSTGGVPDIYSRGGRAKLRWDAFESLSLTLSGSYQQNSSNGAQQGFHGFSSQELVVIIRWPTVSGLPASASGLKKRGCVSAAPKLTHIQMTTLAITSRRS